MMSGAKIGQIIYDINGEYANANQQDQGAMADIYPERAQSATECWKPLDLKNCAPIFTIN